jgi:ADP-ribose pyrophosphatase YjhB (NUDIX family)
LRREKSISNELWKSILQSMPIACVDLIIHRTVKREIWVLLGFRKIYPYNDRWALPGGRIIKGESLRQTADRQLDEIGLRSNGDYMLVGGTRPTSDVGRTSAFACPPTYHHHKSHNRQRN